MSDKENLDLSSEAGPLKESAPAYGTGAPEGIYLLRTPEDQGWTDFREQCRRQMQRPLATRIRYGFCRRRSEPGEATTRAFATMAEYRAWCEANLPDYLGLRRPTQ